jgi:hypothetical protein
MGTSRERLIGDIVVAARGISEYAEIEQVNNRAVFDKLDDALQAWDAYHRAQLLSPNSEIQTIETRFDLSYEITLGRPCKFVIEGHPPRTMRPSRVRINAPVPGFLIIEEWRIANVILNVDTSNHDYREYQEDAFVYTDTPTFDGKQVNWPTLAVQNRFRATLQYTGLVPASLKDCVGVSVGPVTVSGMKFKVQVRLTGPGLIQS